MDKRVQHLRDHEWAYRQPPALVPVPANEALGPVSGQRVVLYAPEGQLWRYAMRAVTEPHWYGDSWCVGVLSESDWYRREHDPNIPIVPVPYPLDRLWVEQPVDTPDSGASEPDQSEVSLDMGHARHVVVDPSQPPVRHLRPALCAEAVLPGDRVCRMSRNGPEWGLRVCGAPRLAEFPETLDLSGDVGDLDRVPIGPKVPLCWEEFWYIWEHTGIAPRATHCWLVPVWIE